MHTIEIGVQITRRKFVHILRDPAGEVLWTARSIGEVLRVCEARGICQVDLHNGDHVWLAQFVVKLPEGA